MTTLTQSAYLVGQTLKEMLLADVSLGLHRVFYGDISKVGATPCATVEPGTKERTHRGTGLWMEIIIPVSIMVYYARIEGEEQLISESDAFVERIESTIHTEPMKTLGGLIVHGWIHRVEPGTAIRAGARLRAHRISWRGISRAHI